MRRITLRSLLFSLTAVVSLTLTATNVNGQLLKRLKQEVKSRAENKAVEEAGNTSEKVMDKVEDGAVNAVKGKCGKDKTSPEEGPANDTSGENTGQLLADYKNYDFVPGDKIIFQPDLSGEADAELPARFTIRAGTAEIESYEGEKVLHLQRDAKTAVEPSMNTDQYLPEQFTLEFDVLYENPDGDYFRYSSDLRVGFSNRGDQNFYNGGLYAFVINGVARCSLGKTGIQEFPAALRKSFGKGNTWHHIAIYVRKNIGKAYVDAYRVCATNTLPTGAGKLYIKADRYGIKIKNLRLAAGGEDKYNEIIADGKFITHGILFDVNKASIKPESMGTLNGIAKLMKDHADLKFEIDGYTDSDGSDDANMKLSQDRADAVKSQLVQMGVDEARLTAKGFGETKPIDKNDSAEGKANNRRVEFVKI
ncbi:MAG TPA: OmpA family protein [Puia sp.]|nr:OmpA family protein [Puia sp.]